MMAEVTIVVKRDAHDDTYYTILQNRSYIVAERVNDLDDAMMFVKNKLKQIDGDSCED